MLKWIINVQRFFKVYTERKFLIIISFINIILISPDGVKILTNIKRIILDVLKPHAPSIIEVAERIGKLEGISGVNISLEEVDAETDSVKITIEGSNINSVEAMTEMLALARQYELHVKVMSTLDQVSESAVQVLRVS